MRKKNNGHFIIIQWQPHIVCFLRNPIELGLRITDHEKTKARVSLYLIKNSL